MSEITTRQQDPAGELIARLRGDGFKRQAELLLPPELSVDRFVRVTATTIQTNPDIAQCDPDSIFRAVLRCAQDGLLPDGKQAAIVKRKNQASYMPMIGGIVSRAADYGWTIRAKAVYSEDVFDYSEEPQSITHRPVRPGMERGDLIAAYATATHRDGRRMQAVLHPADIAKRRAKAMTQNVWNEWPAPMWEKSAAHDLYDQLPLPESAKISREPLTTTDPLAALYGNRGYTISSGQPAPADETDTLGLPVGGADGSVSGPGETVGADPLPPADSLDDEPGPNVFDLDAAGETHPPGGKRKDDTLGQIVDEALEGDADARQWLTFALGFDGWKGTEFDATLRGYLRARLPILLDLAEEGRS